MQDHLGYNEFGEQNARKSAKEFERMLRRQEYQYLDLIKVDEIFNYYLNLNELGKAQQLVEFAIHSHPSSSDLYYKSSKIKFEFGKFVNALTQIELALSYSPGHPEYLTFKAELLAQLDRYPEAINMLGQLMNYTDHPEEVYLQMGNIAQICKQAEDSERFYRKALDICPDFEEALFELVFLLESKERIEEGAKLYEQYLEKFPYSSFVWHNLGTSYRKLGNYEKALEAFDYAVIINDEFSIAYFNKGELLIDLDRYEEALQCFLEVAAIQPKDVHTFYHIAECYENLEMYKYAIRYYAKSSKLDPEYVDAWLGLGYCLEKLEKFLEAVHYYSKAYKLDSDNQDICLSLAICEYKLENKYSAYQYLEHAIAIDPSELSVWQEWAQLLHMQGEHSSAISYLEEGIKINPTMAQLYYQLAAYAIDADHMAKGVSHLENALIMDFDAHYVLFHMVPQLSSDKLVLAIINQYQ